MIAIEPHDVGSVISTTSFPGNGDSIIDPRRNGTHKRGLTGSSQLRLVGCEEHGITTSSLYVEQRQNSPYRMDTIWFRSAIFPFRQIVLLQNQKQEVLILGYRTFRTMDDRDLLVCPEA